MSRSRRGVIIGAVFGLALLALAGCSSGSPSPAGTSSAPTSSTAVAGAAWLDGGHAVAVVSMGSSSCIPAAGAISASGQKVTVEFAAPPANQACTSDFVPRATYVALPDGVNPAQNVQVTANGSVTGTVTLAGLTQGVATADQTPTAGWIEGMQSGGELSAGAFAFVTWGSSTCPPALAAVTAASASDITVVLAAPPGQKTCTMDMAPRAAVAVSPPTVTGADVTVSFEGDGITGSTKMLGTR
ncbi:hypothetical protein [Microbacterium candidum]|uniref:DUF4232 domain-containing protein n=1 Tax=Microbacterium candidum TaxID=3041922 RepID=A0ABT7MV16_9MICO|nr:hypothetical protein [Microbacterium sp. ASV49]MDL9978290.1 hypothetical protein [Microbacterium sp. ASV49]